MIYAPWLLIALSALPSGPDTVVVSPPGYMEALRPWVAHRAGQGHRFAFVSNLGSAQQIRSEIRRHGEAGNLKYIVLIGDAEPQAQSNILVRARCIPTHMAKAQVNVRWHSTPELPTDNWYADLDDDQIPDVAIGRLPADSPQQLSVLVGKILHYENEVQPSAWCHRVNLVAGIGGFGPLIDPLLEMATKKFVTDGIPPEYETTMTYGSWRSPFCPSPFRFHATTVQRLNEGCLFWVYIGHGYPYELDRVRVPGRTFHILNTNDMGSLGNFTSPPIAIFLACYTGAFDQPADCLAERMLLAPGGPVAVLAGSRVMMPYAMAVFGNGLMDEYFKRRRPTLGEVILYAKRRMVAQEPRGTNRKLLDLVAATISPDARMLREERQEHVLLYNLLGDPLLRLYYPEHIDVSVPETISAGSYLQVSGTSPLSGRCTIELVCRRDKFKFTPTTRHRFNPTAEGQTELTNTYLRANDRRWTARQIAIVAGPILTAIRVPKQARGPCHVRISV